MAGHIKDRRHKHKGSDDTGSTGSKKTFGKKHHSSHANQRLEKIEKYLQERFNWLNKKDSSKTISRIGSASKRRARAQSQYPNIQPLFQGMKQDPAKKQRFNYMVDTSEKPQDPGKVN